MTTSPCHCPAYSFPHRMGGGKCHRTRFSSHYCSDCLHPDDGKCIDEGIGAYEYWGARGVHIDLQIVSSCCGADVLDYNTNELLTLRQWEAQYDPT